MFLTDKWKDYQLLSAGNGEKIEKWGKYILQRPDPVAIWPDFSSLPSIDGQYFRSESGGGFWEKSSRLPNQWQISYPSRCGELKFIVEPTGFKHTGLFPEQGTNWDFCQKIIQEAHQRDPQAEIKILNLFAYTGGATLACAQAGADEVVHVDASKGMVARAKENVNLSGLDHRYIRFITEDCNRFVEREIRRGRKYQGIIMDPPAYGRGPSGEIWKLETSLYPLVQKISQLLDQNSLFFLINSYTTSFSPLVVENILHLTVRADLKGRVESEELGLPARDMPLVLPCGCTSRWIGNTY